MRWATAFIIAAIALVCGYRRSDIAAARHIPFAMLCSDAHGKGWWLVTIIHTVL